MASGVKLENVSKTIKGRTVLQDITIHFEKKQITSVRGRNGSGKTMLFRAIAGLIKTSGSIQINGKKQLADGSFASDMGILLENPGFLDEFTGYKNLELLAMFDKPKKIIGTEIKRILELVGLDHNDKRKYSKYSLGMKQRLGIAQAIAFQPSIILLDEPTNAIDEKGIEEMINLLLRIRDEGSTILVASHDATFLNRISDKTFVMESGRLREEQGS